MGILFRSHYSIRKHYQAGAKGLALLMLAQTVMALNFTFQTSGKAIGLLYSSSINLYVYQVGVLLSVVGVAVTMVSLFQPRMLRMSQWVSIDSKFFHLRTGFHAIHIPIHEIKKLFIFIKRDGKAMVLILQSGACLRSTQVVNGEELYETAKRISIPVTKSSFTFYSLSFFICMGILLLFTEHFAANNQVLLGGLLLFLPFIIALRLKKSQIVKKSFTGISKPSGVALFSGIAIYSLSYVFFHYASVPLTESDRSFRTAQQLYQQGHFSESQEIIKIIVETSKFPAHLNFYAWLLTVNPEIEKRDYGKASELAEQATQSLPRRSYFDTLSCALYGAGKKEEALNLSSKHQFLAARFNQFQAGEPCTLDEKGQAARYPASISSPDRPASFKKEN